MENQPNKLIAIFLAGLVLGLSLGVKIPNSLVAVVSGGKNDEQSLEKLILPETGFRLPVQWGSLGEALVQAGVIDEAKFNFGEVLRNPGFIQITAENAHAVLNMLWALGLSNKNEILEKGPMQDSQYGGAKNFASTGGWTLGQGDALTHYSRHQFFTLTEEQQTLVERVSKNIYRPCCNNSTFFPDCNHGMAMLGLLELMAAQGVGEEEIYKTALRANSFWFPETYLTIAKFLQSKGIGWERTDPKEILGNNFSSASGYQQVFNAVTPVKKRQGGGSCGA